MNRKDSGQRIGNFAAGLVLSLLVMGGLMTALVYAGGLWNFLANTRLLDLLVKAGVIQWHDRTQGITFIPDAKYYLLSQDPVRWDIIFLVVVFYFFVFSFKALQFNAIARMLGLKTNLGQNLRAYCYGLSWNKTAPFGFGDTAAALALADEGVPLARAKTAVFIAKLFELLEIAVFAFVGLVVLGWSTWLAQMFWAIVIALVAYALVRRSHGADSEDWSLTAWWKSAKQGARLVLDHPMGALWLTFLSLFAFFLQDESAYFTAMGFSGENVFLLVDFSVVLMAVVAYHIARLVRFTPGGIGQGEWAFAAALWVGGVGFPECMTIAILHWGVRLFSVGNFHFLVTNGWEGSVKTTLAEIIAAFRRGPKDSEPADKDTSLVEADAPGGLPETTLPRAPSALIIWRRLAVVGLVFLGIFFLDQLSLLLFHYWFLEGLKLSSVFSTNFAMGSKLFLLGLVTMTAGVALPAFIYKVNKDQRRLIVIVAVIAGSLGGYFLSLEYLDFLLFGGKAFGEADPVYGKDIGFYVYELSNWWTLWKAAAWGTTLGLLSAIACSYLEWVNEGRPAVSSNMGVSQFWGTLGRIFDKRSYPAIVFFGLAMAWGEWLSRYNLILKFNEKHAVKYGGTYIDVEGLFSNRVYVYVTTLVILGITGALIGYFKTLNSAAGGNASGEWRMQLHKFRNVIFALALLDFGFKGLVAVREWVGVKPNEPVIQLPYIGRHVDATRKAYDLDKVEEVEFIPAGPGDPVPSADDLLKHPTLKNAPLWPGFSAYLEAQLDPQHSLRILQTKGDKMIYGPTMEIFYQQQKLRAYYNFLGIDQVRYNIGGEKKMFVSAIREVPLVEPQPWLAWWGQQYMLFTHGHGLVMAEASKTTPEGEPVYVSSAIPVQTTIPELKVDNPRVYYGEGSGTMAYSNIKDVQELDYPTAQDRATLELPQEQGTGIHLDSLIKRLAFGWRSGQFFEVVFSDLITDDSRVHYFRSPLDRLDRVAPFLYYDASAYAVAADGKIVWMVNALSTSNMYPYSMMGDLGDKSDERSRYPRPHRWVNYVEDSVKVTVDAFSGEVKFYKLSDDPVIHTWSLIYPELFVDAKEMPASVKAQVTYPLQYFHLQFDDHYIYYHMKDPMYFFNMEDMFDDADEVLGAIMDSGHAIRFSTEPQSILLETGGPIPEAKDKLQYALLMPFTSEKALGLRALPIAYQDWNDYGRLVSLMVPKGHFTWGPEQADAAIDQSPEISRNFAWWNRRGSDVIRGHTSTLIVGKEVIYVEPIFIRSQQNQTTQLKRVAVVFRGVARIGHTLDEALRAAIEDYKKGARGPTSAAEPEAESAGHLPGGPPAGKGAKTRGS
ncbi:MAG: UPF0182 family protein [Bdellovibrionota bacterium]